MKIGGNKEQIQRKMKKERVYTYTYRHGLGRVVRGLCKPAKVKLVAQTPVSNFKRLLCSRRHQRAPEPTLAGVCILHDGVLVELRHFDGRRVPFRAAAEWLGHLQTCEMLEVAQADVAGCVLVAVPGARHPCRASLHDACMYGCVWVCECV